MEKEYSIGIDIGGTNTALGIVDRCGRIRSQRSIKTGQHPDPEGYVAALCRSIAELTAETSAASSIAGLGIGAPNGNYFSGSIEYAPNLRHWGDVVPLAEMLSERLDLPVALTNDANAAALGEMSHGAARGMRDFIVITLGTGLGAGIVANGELVYGHRGFAGELGHVTAVRDGRTCNCGKKGCLEQYASATGLVRTAREFCSARGGKSLLRGINPDEITSADVHKAAVKGDRIAQETFEHTGMLLGRAFADFAVFSDPEAIILFGGLTQAGDLLLNPIRKSMEKNILPLFRGKIKVLASQLRESDAAILGASSLGRSG